MQSGTESFYPECYDLSKEKDEFISAFQMSKCQSVLIGFVDDYAKYKRDNPESNYPTANDGSRPGSKEVPSKEQVGGSSSSTAARPVCIGDNTINPATGKPYEPSFLTDVYTHSEDVVRISLTVIKRTLQGMDDHVIDNPGL